MGLLESIKALVQQAEEKAQQTGDRAVQAEAIAWQNEQTLDTIFNSRSWRLTAPLRWLGFQGRLLRDLGLYGRARLLAVRLGKPIAERAFIFICMWPNLRLWSINLARKLGLYEWLRTFYQKLTDPSFAGFSPSPARNATVDNNVFDERLVYLSSKTRRICSDLKAAIKKNKEVS